MTKDAGGTEERARPLYGRIPKMKVAAGKKLREDIRPLRSHPVGDLGTKVSRKKLTDAEQSAQFDWLSRDLGSAPDAVKCKGVLRKLENPGD